MNAQQAANLAIRDVLPQLQPKSPEAFVLGGYSALAAEGRALKNLGHTLSVMTLLERAPVPLNLAPIVVHLPDGFCDNTNNAQRSEAAEADQGNTSRSMHAPFRTSNFVREVATAHGVAPVPCSLKFMNLSIDPGSNNRLVDIVRVRSANVHYLTWPAVAVEQLVLGADTTLEEGIYAAFMFVRWACRLGSEEIEYSRVRREGPPPHPPHRFFSVEAALTAAATSMLHTEKGQTVLAVWLPRLETLSTVALTLREDNTMSTVSGRDSWGTLEASYDDLIRKLKVVLRAVYDTHPHRAHSLVKTAFEPGSRETGERALAFA